jgi:bisphosphoglycerate-independent phosphoglycerate mutase (AlkP superfamily)
MFEYWPSDFAGHHQDMQAASQLLTVFDQVIAGILSRWDLANDLILITSDHGNMEDITTRKHTLNDVPAIIIANPDLRHTFTNELDKLSDVAPRILDLYE